MNDFTPDLCCDGAASHNIVERIVGDVLHSIRSGRMVPGQHLVETDLTARYGVSRGSLREGLKQLAADGIVSLTRHRGAFIAALDRRGMLDLLDVLEPLCTLAARLAAQRPQEAGQHAELHGIALALRQGSRMTSRAAYLENRRRFYDQLVAMAGNDELRRIIPLNRVDLFRAQFDVARTPEQQHRRAAGYMRIANAVADGDAAKAQRMVKQHFAGSRRALEERGEESFGG
jgi:DNA-binding GntR family transcriptional regulator